MNPSLITTIPRTTDYKLRNHSARTIISFLFRIVSAVQWDPIRLLQQPVPSGRTPVQTVFHEAGLHNIRPVEAFLAAHENFLNRRKCCESSTSSKKLSFQNLFNTTTKSLHWNWIDFCGSRQIYVDNLALRDFRVVQACPKAYSKQDNVHHYFTFPWKCRWCVSAIYRQ